MPQATVFVHSKAAFYFLSASAEPSGLKVSVPFPVGECITFSSVVEEIVIGIAVVVMLNSA